MIRPEGISLRPQPAAAPAAAAGAKVAGAAGRKATELAQDFEATFLSLLLKEMRQTLEPDGLFAGDAGDVHGGLFDLYLGKHLAEAGGVGLAAAIQSYLRPTTPTPAADGPKPVSRPAGRSILASSPA